MSRFEKSMSEYLTCKPDGGCLLREYWLANLGVVMISIFIGFLSFFIGPLVLFIQIPWLLLTFVANLCLWARRARGVFGVAAPSMYVIAATIGLGLLGVLGAVNNQGEVAAFFLITAMLLNFAICVIFGAVPSRYFVED